MKTCLSCKKVFPLSFFHKSSRQKDGFFYYCKECKRIKAKKEYFKHKASYKARCYFWRKTDKGKASLRKTYANQKAKSPEKYKARTILNSAVVAKKVLKPKECQQCKKKRRVAGHHNDYSKPLEVLWLCYKCHTLLHREKISS